MKDATARISVEPRAVNPDRAARLGFTAQDSVPVPVKSVDAASLPRESVALSVPDKSIADSDLDSFLKANKRQTHSWVDSIKAFFVHPTTIAALLLGMLVLIIVMLVNSIWRHRPKCDECPPCVTPTPSPSITPTENCPTPTPTETGSVTEFIVNWEASRQVLPEDELVFTSADDGVTAVCSLESVLSKNKKVRVQLRGPGPFVARVNVQGQASHVCSLELSNCITVGDENTECAMHIEDTQNIPLFDIASCQRM